MADFKKIAMASAGVAAISYALGWVYNRFIPDGIATITFSAVEVPVKQQIQAGINTSLGGKLLSYLGGVIPQGGQIAAILTLFVASFAIVWLASLISERINFGKTESIKFGVSMTIAAGLIGVIVGYMTPAIGQIGALLAMLVYFGIIAAVYVSLRNVEGVKDWFPAL